MLISTSKWRRDPGERERRGNRRHRTVVAWTRRSRVVWVWMLGWMRVWVLGWVLGWVLETETSKDVLHITMIG